MKDQLMGFHECSCLCVGISCVCTFTGQLKAIETKRSDMYGILHYRCSRVSSAAPKSLKSRRATFPGGPW